jgi:hypothetical protein
MSLAAFVCGIDKHTWCGRYPDARRARFTKSLLTGRTGIIHDLHQS